MSRWKAAGIHFVLCTFIAAAFVLAMYELWYPPRVVGAVPPTDAADARPWRAQC